MYTFDKILAHQGPLLPRDRKYRGSPYSLKIRWSTGETTWEPLRNVFADAPHAVTEYAKSQNLLDNRHWSHVRDFSLDPTKMEDADFHEEQDFDTSPIDPAATDKPLSEQFKRLLGFNGETCYVIISDRKSGSIKYSIRRDKTPPIDFFKSFIANYKPSVTGCSVRFDGGGELGGCTEVHNLFSSAGYDVKVTPPKSSSAIGQAERPH